MVTNSKTDLKFTTTDDAENKKTTTISYINPELSDNDAITLCQKFNALSTEIFVDVTRVKTETLARDE